MFCELTIRNFQSHKDTLINFTEGTNVVIGSSDQGKSAVIRAILWAVNNRPLGIESLVSHWARDEKNKITDAMLVKIVTDNGIAVRRRTADTNEYVLIDNEGKKKVFEAVNKEVPEDVQKFFRLSDVNVQQQHDAPFLLSASASDVAKYFNKIVRLDVIDTVLGNAESARRDTNKKIKETETEKINLEKQLENYDWIEAAQIFVEKLSNVTERINTYDDEWQVIDCEVQDYLIQKKYLKDFPDIKKASAIIEKIEAIKIDYNGAMELEKEIEKYKEVNKNRKIFDMVKSGKEIINQIDGYKIDIDIKQSEINLLQKEIDNYTENKKLSDMGFDKKRAADLIKQIEAIRPDYDELRLLCDQVNEYGTSKKIKESEDIGIADLKKQLPAECPLCGAPMGECKE